MSAIEKAKPPSPSVRSISISLSGSGDSGAFQTTSHPILQVLHKMASAILARKPTFIGEIVPKHGKGNLYEYSKTIIQPFASHWFKTRHLQVAEVTKELLAPRLGEANAENISQQLLELPIVSTSDHHGSINHPMPLNANLICGLPYAEENKAANLVVFTFGGVSANNFLAYGRGIEFHDDTDKADLIRIPLLSDKLKMGVMCALPAFTKENVMKAIAEVEKKQKEGLITQEKSCKIIQILNDVYASEEVLKIKDLAGQITKVNYILWPTLFHPANQNPSSGKTPNLVYLEIESVVSELLMRFHLNNPQSLLSRLLFNQDFQQKVLQHFNNLPGGFSRENNNGSYLFWHVDEKFRRAALYLKDGYLQTENGEWKCKMDAPSLLEALQSKKIFPGMLLSYLVIGLYYGIKCLGGFCQVYDLSVLKTTWVKLLNELNENVEAEAVTHINTKTFSGDGLILAYTQTKQGGYIPASGFDLMTSTMDSSYQKYIGLAKKVLFSDMVLPCLPSMYQVLYHIEERDPQLLNVTSEEIIKSTGLNRKLQQVS